MARITLDEICFQQRCWSKRVGTDEVATTVVFPVDGNAAEYQRRVDEVAPEAGSIGVRRGGHGMIGCLQLEGDLDDVAAKVLLLMRGGDEPVPGEVAELVHTIAPNRPVRMVAGRNWERQRRVIASTVTTGGEHRWFTPLSPAGREAGLAQTHRLQPVEGQALFAGAPANVVSAALRDAGQVVRPEYVRAVAEAVDPHWVDPYRRVRTRDTHDLLDTVVRRKRALVFTDELDERLLGDGVVQWRTNPEAVVHELRELSERFRVRCELLTPVSQVGGVPLVRFTGERAEHVVRVYGAVHRWPLTQCEAVLQELGDLFDVGWT